MVGVGAGTGICLELKPEPEISKMGGYGNPGNFDASSTTPEPKNVLCFRVFLICQSTFEH